MRRRSKMMAALLAAAMVITAIPVSEVGATEATTSTVPSGYTLKWSDEFDGDSLDRSKWNVETHEAGWVNSELQEYVDSKDNIQVSDGTLKLIPKKTETTSTTVAKNNLLKNADFSDGKNGWTETIANWEGYVTDASSSAANGAITYTINNPGTDDWHVQLKQSGIALKAGKTYVASYTVTSSVARQIKSGVMSTSYVWYGGSDPVLSAGVATPISFEFTMAADDSAADFYISMGKVGDTPVGTITISDICLEEKAETNMVAGATFGDKATNGVITQEVTTANMGNAIWDLQALANVAIESGKTYTISFTASSTVPRSIVCGVQQTVSPWGQYYQDFPYLTTESKNFTYEFTASTTDANAGFYFNLGKDDSATESTITISNIKFEEKASTVAKTTTTYTSGRISTQNLETFTYGYFECRAKVPSGQGYLPAFWLMANNENIYGQWPRCGEIDCMEVMGQDTSKVYGTIHYGNPHEESQGTYTTTDLSADFHTYACEWEPGKITWYIDGVKYHEESSWYSTTEGQGTLTYPAPFDQPFYIILNLAVGGSWVGNPDSTTSFENQDYEIDYVRVYQKDSYDENVTAPVKEVTLRDADATGNYINNGTFATSEDLTDDSDWKFLTALGGEATATIAENEMKIETTNEGTVDYSVQLVQAALPFEKGATYQVQFDAYADSAREMGVDIKAPDHGYTTYMDHQTAALTTEKQTYTYTFKMKSATDANGRLEYNMGATGSAATIHISNVSVKKIADADPNEVEAKTVLSDGNYVYNGSFDQGDSHLGYWTVEKIGNATTTVTNFTDGRQFSLRANSGEAKVRLTQTDLAFTEGNTYAFSFKATSESATQALAVIGGHKYLVDLEAGTKTYTINLPSSLTYSDKNVQLILSTKDSVKIDDVTLAEAGLLKNGNFSADMTGYTVYVDSSASASYAVDSLKEDSALSVTVKDTGDADWKVQIKQENIPLVKGNTYKLTLKAKSTINRKMRFIMQGQENKDWAVYSATTENGDGIVDLTSDFTTFTQEFTMTADTDTAAFLSICLGKIDEQISTQHTVVIDDITLELVAAGENADEATTSTTSYKEVSADKLEKGFGKEASVHDNKNVTVTKEEGSSAVVVKKENPSSQAPGQAKKQATTKANKKNGKTNAKEKTITDDQTAKADGTAEVTEDTVTETEAAIVETEAASADEATIADDATAKTGAKKVALPIVFVLLALILGSGCAFGIISKKKNL